MPITSYEERPDEFFAGDITSYETANIKSRGCEEADGVKFGYGLVNGTDPEFQAKLPTERIYAAFDVGEDYVVGDLVTYSGARYICSTDHDAGAWDAGDFTAVTEDVETYIGASVNMFRQKDCDGVSKYKLNDPMSVLTKGEIAAVLVPGITIASGNKVYLETLAANSGQYTNVATTSTIGPLAGARFAGVKRVTANNEELGKIEFNQP